MRPTRRKRVTRGRTAASACRASSMRGLMVAMPWLTLPAMEPDASNTIIASSEQGEGVASAGRAGSARARGATKAVAAANFRTCAQDAEDMADLISYQRLVELRDYRRSIGRPLWYFAHFLRFTVRARSSRDGPPGAERCDPILTGGQLRRSADR